MSHSGIAFESLAAGALIGKKITYSGNGRIIFDRQLAEDAVSIEVGNHMLSSFSWKKY